MAKIIIKNIGPIKLAQFDLNKVNVFIGPQSSGKSTIAKIISYCTWVEKDVATSQSLKSYQDNKILFRTHLENFHKIKGYFKDDSYILYKSETVEIKWENQKSEIKWINRFAYKRSKISYIPSERNLITLPEVEKVEFGSTNIRSFLFDWLDARKSYTQENKLSILNLDVDYYFIDNGVIKEDHIQGKNNEKKYDILLSNASSGLQSITPLVAMIDYLTKWIYKNEDKTSFEKDEKERAITTILSNELVIRKFIEKHKKKSDAIEDYNQINKEIDELLEKKDKELLSYIENWYNVRNNLFKTDKTQFIIEEPEQNLFPSTQKELIYYLLNAINYKRGDRVTITTHSPYILYALNNCMLGYLVKEKMTQDEDYEELKSINSSIDPKNVSVWQITNSGEIKNIQGEDYLIQNNYFDECMKGVMDDFYKMINYYGDEDED